eukprot:COSAG01_NODE_10260_length_2208_cov_0.909436_2_plen_62_part_00
MYGALASIVKGGAATEGFWVVWVCCVLFGSVVVVGTMLVVAVISSAVVALQHLMYSMIGAS